MRQPRSARVSVETTFIREFASTYGSELAWTIEAEQQMHATRIYLPQILQVMRSGVVVRSDKESASMCTFTVVGRTIEDDFVELQLEVEYDRYRVRLTNLQEQSTR